MSPPPPENEANPTPSTSTSTGGRVRHLRACDRPAKKKRKADSVAESNDSGRSPANPDSPAARPLLLGVDETATFFTTPEGLARFCGSTSGLPLLEATRRLSKAQPNAASASKEPDWSWLDQLLNGRPAATASPNSSAASPAEDHEFFPGRELQANNVVDAHNMILEIIPVDLLGVLIHLFFEVVHPQWPILHVPTFLASTHKWREPAFAALVLSMCMLASRYCVDPRVRADPNNPTSAGYNYYATFRRLREMASLGSDDAVEAIQALFFCSQWHSVDTLPHPIAQGLFGDAVARVYDGGLHRGTSHPGLGTAVELEVRKRTAWAVYCYDKHLAAVAGRPPLMPLAYLDIQSPSPYPPAAVPSPTDENACRRDVIDCETFQQLVLISATMEKVLRSTNQPPHFTENSLLDRLSGGSKWTPDRDFKEPAEAEEFLDEWFKQLPPSLCEDVDARSRLPTFSPRSETVLATGETCRIILASRRLQLTTIELTSVAATEKERSATLRVELRQHRLQLLNTIKRLVSSAIKIGAANMMQTCEIFFAYRLLLAGRLTIAVVLSAREDNDAHEVQALHTLEACVVLLSHFALAFPVSLGAAETLKETCRVCQIHLSKATLETSSHGRYAWHRPLPRGANHNIHPPTRLPPSDNLRPPVFPPNTSPSSAPPAQSNNAFSPLDPSVAASLSMPLPPNPLDSSPNVLFPHGSGNTPFASGSSGAGGAIGLSPGGMDAWAHLLNQSPSASGMPMTSLGTPGAANATTPGGGAGMAQFGDVSDLSWLYPGETQKETCRVCQIHLSKATLGTSSHGRNASSTDLRIRTSVLLVKTQIGLSVLGIF
ncbi:hypothetical protein JCM8547_007558 [Rhodosporidiobolus lusitaniae]